MEQIEKDVAVMEKKLGITGEPRMKYTITLRLANPAEPNIVGTGDSFLGASSDLLAKVNAIEQRLDVYSSELMKGLATLIDNWKDDEVEKYDYNDEDEPDFAFSLNAEREW